MLSFKSHIKKPRFRPTINVGCLMDIPTGSYEDGLRGEALMAGGINTLTGIAARPNNFKTALAIHFMAQILKTVRSSAELIYDTEGTLPIPRFTAACAWDHYLSTFDFNDEENARFTHTDLSQYDGDEFFAVFREAVKEKNTKEGEKAHTMTTPFLGNDGKEQTALIPTGCLIDSFSKFQISTVHALYDKNKIGDSANNTDAMQMGKAKKQMLNQMPQLTARTGTYMVMTAHVGDIINVEAYPTDKRNLSYMQRDTVLKGVSPDFYSLPHNVWMITKNKPILNKDKMPEYPWDNATAMKGDTDLTEITMMNLRGKSGLSGVPISLVISQSEGLQPALSEFNYCKHYDRFGLEGNLQNYNLALMPETTLSRTKVRQKLQGSYELQRAAQLTADLLQIQQFHRQFNPNLLCTPSELYQDLHAKGHDWSVLRQTRGYWTFLEEEDQHEYPFLSMPDLLRMRKGPYVPFWYTKEQTAAVEKATGENARSLKNAAEAYPLYTGQSV